MNKQDWMDLGFTSQEAIDMVEESKEEANYEEAAHVNFYSNNI